MRWPLVSFSLLFIMGLLCVGVDVSWSSGCFIGDFDTDGDPWTIRTDCSGSPCSLNFIYEVPAQAPTVRDFTIYVTEGCCDVGWDGFYGTRVEMVMDPAYVGSWTAAYPTCTCCSTWIIFGTFRDDVPLVPGERYVIGTGSAEALCNDEYWQCPPPHEFVAEFMLNEDPACAGSEIRMSLECPVSDVPASELMATVQLGAPSPNPVASLLRYTLSLREAAHVSVRVFDTGGAVVATLVDGEAPAGDHLRSWEPIGPHGNRLPNGIYFLRLDALGVRQARPFVVAH